MYPPDLVKPMREDLTRNGFTELHTKEDVEAAMKKEGTTLMVVNSVCGCAARNARPAAVHAVVNGKKPDNIYTVFAGVDGEATDFARSYIEQHINRPLFAKYSRWFFSKTIPNPGLFRISLLFVILARPLLNMLGPKIRSVIKFVPSELIKNSILGTPQRFYPAGNPRLRVALLAGCAQQVLRQYINEATIRLLNRKGCESVSYTHLTLPTNAYV